MRQACKDGDVDVVRRLIDGGVDVSPVLSLCDMWEVAGAIGDGN